MKTKHLLYLIPLLLIGCNPYTKIVPGRVYSPSCFATNYTIVTDGYSYRVKSPVGAIYSNEYSWKISAENFAKAMARLYLEEANKNQTVWTEVK